VSGTPSKAVVWAHNSHLGDARATDMSWRRKELNVGQLVREHYGDLAYGIGFRCARAPTNGFRTSFFLLLFQTKEPTTRNKEKSQ
jgi:erythromycin esterase-like protein